MMTRLFRIAALSLGIAALGGVSLGQDIRRAEPVAPARTPSTISAGGSALERSGMSAVPVDANRRLTVGDIVSVEIIEDREPPVLRKISATGDLDLGLLGRVRVAGKSTYQAEADVKAYLERDYYYTATVRIGLDTVNATSVIRKVIVSGAVNAPGPIEIAAGETLTLTEAILRAGGFDKFGKRTNVKLYRGTSLYGTYDVKKIEKEGRIADDPPLRDGDRIFIEKSNFNFGNQ
jgi:protein involved in polysaccharide export with SLBB domain